jgi:IS5 family transposase
VRGTSGAVNDVIEANSLVRESDREVFADAGYQGAGKRPDARQDVSWHIAVRPGQTDRGPDRETGAREGRHSGAGGTPVLSDQAPVRPHQCALPRAGLEHRAAAHAVCAGQSLDGAAQTAGSLGMSAPAVRQTGHSGRQFGAAGAGAGAN